MQKHIHQSHNYHPHHGLYHGHHFHHIIIIIITKPILSHLRQRRQHYIYPSPIPIVDTKRWNQQYPHLNFHSHCHV